MDETGTLRSGQMWKVKKSKSNTTPAKQSVVVRALTLVSDGQHSRWAPINLRFIDGGFEWTLTERPLGPMTIEFADIVKANYDIESSTWEFTTQPTSYPEGLLRYNPAGLLESKFGRLPLEVAERIDDGLVNSRGVIASADRPRRTGAALIGMVDSLNECPRCGGFFRARTANTVECHICDLIYANRRIRPTIGWDEYDQWAVTGEVQWIPLSDSDLKFAESSLIWVAPPRPELPGPFIVREMMMEALGIRDEP